MNKMQAIGAGFLTQYSTNSDLKPKLFEWTQEDSPVKVFIDGAIFPGMGYQKKSGEKKIAWVCESRAIFHSWNVPIDIWSEHIKTIASNYDILFVSDKQWLDKAPNIKYCSAGSNLPWIKNQQIFNKRKMTSMFASNKLVTFGHKIRHSVAEKFKDKIDLFGGAAGSSRLGESNSPWPDKSEALNDYMFHITIENDKYETYFTEKLTDCFATGTIPIYWGPSTISEYFNKDGIIELTPEFDLNLLTKELYESKIEAIKDNFNRVQNLISADDQLYNLIYEN